MTTYDHRPAAERFRTVDAGRDTWHSFSFGAHYDPVDVGFGRLVACNDDTLQPGAGYDPHEHRGLEIVTWVVEGELSHGDSTGRSAEVLPGVLQRLRAGRGVVHSERNEAMTAVRFVQMWLPGEPDAEPRYELRDVRELLAGGGLAPVLDLPGSRLHVARLPAAGRAVLPAAPYLHLQVVRGSAQVAGAPSLGSGDVLRISGSVGEELLAGPDGAELLAWEMSAAVAPPFC